MKPAEAAREIVALLEEAARIGGAAPSAELVQFLNELADSIGLKKSERRPRGASAGEGRTRVARPRQRPTEDEMSKTIDELAATLKLSFNSDASFEAAISQPTVQKLSKPNVVTLFNRVFDTSRAFPKSLTKPDLFNAMRRERISRVRGGM